MDCRNGYIHNAQDMQELARELKRANRHKELKHFVPLTEDLARELEPLGGRQRKNTMRNKPCVCGSGIKFKRCCWSNYV